MEGRSPGAKNCKQEHGVHRKNHQPRQHYQTAQCSTAANRSMECIGRTINRGSTTRQPNAAHVRRLTGAWTASDILGSARSDSSQSQHFNRSRVEISGNLKQRTTRFYYVIRPKRATRMGLQKKERGEEVSAGTIKHGPRERQVHSQFSSTIFTLSNVSKCFQMFVKCF